MDSFLKTIKLAKNPNSAVHKCLNIYAHFWVHLCVSLCTFCSVFHRIFQNCRTTSYCVGSSQRSGSLNLAGDTAKIRKTFKW